MTGVPLRTEVLHPISHGAHEFLDLEKFVPVIFVTGGSQGSERINDTLIDILPELLKRYQVIHQVGRANHAGAAGRTGTILTDHPNRKRYKLFDYLNETALRMVAGVADLAITRAGATTLAELAHWSIPAIVIPIPEEVSHDQRTNALTYAATGAGVVIEDKNLTDSILLAEINRLFDDPALLEKMRASTKQFARPKAGRQIAQEILRIALEHER
jgi:UDP-N-acetylglucosamine--N-acetylmuramyl-(pentapeptide) pyrophosphoryl-undecaprenol N-acetylglucosamine transferase